MSTIAILDKWATKIPANERDQFRSDCAQVDGLMATLVKAFLPSGTYQIPARSADVRFTLEVKGQPTREDWIRVQAFAGLAAGDLDEDLSRIDAALRGTQT